MKNHIWLKLFNVHWTYLLNIHRTQYELYNCLFATKYVLAVPIREFLCFYDSFYDNSNVQNVHKDFP